MRILPWTGKVKVVQLSKEDVLEALTENVSICDGKNITNFVDRDGVRGV